MKIVLLVLLSFVSLLLMVLFLTTVYHSVKTAAVRVVCIKPQNLIERCLGMWKSEYFNMFI